MSGSRVTFLGDAMAAVVQGVNAVSTLIGQPPVIVGGLAVLARLSKPYRATVDLDVVDRLLGEAPQLEVLRAANRAEPVEPVGVLLPTQFGAVKVDVLEVRQEGLPAGPVSRVVAPPHGVVEWSLRHGFLGVSSSGATILMDATASLPAAEIRHTWLRILAQWIVGGLL